MAWSEVAKHFKNQCCKRNISGGLLEFISNLQNLQTFHKQTKFLLCHGAVNVFLISSLTVKYLDEVSPDNSLNSSMHPHHVKEDKDKTHYPIFEIKISWVGVELLLIKCWNYPPTDRLYCILSGNIILQVSMYMNCCGHTHSIVFQHLNQNTVNA